ncbi:hypothetical protein GGI07_002372 [Coemansia sp. Benny D115]|nr:hypothetical protein GGI07_002372 [Coemansia sp. Benny D115]
MPTSSPIPANIRKRSELYAKNIKNRGNVKKSLDPKVEQRLESERISKTGLTANTPTMSTGSRRLIVAFLVLTLGSALYQACLPFFSSSSSHSTSKQTPKTAKALTREQQAQAAQAVLQEMNRKATEKYFSMAKNYQPPPKQQSPLGYREEGDIDPEKFREAIKNFAVEEDEDGQLVFKKQGAGEQDAGEQDVDDQVPPVGKEQEEPAVEGPLV